MGLVQVPYDVGSVVKPLYEGTCPRTTAATYLPHTPHTLAQPIPPRLRSQRASMVHTARTHPPQPHRKRHSCPYAHLVGHLPATYTANTLTQTAHHAHNTPRQPPTTPTTPTIQIDVAIQIAKGCEHLASRRLVYNDFDIQKNKTSIVYNDFDINFNFLLWIIPRASGSCANPPTCAAGWPLLGAHTG